MLSVFPFLFNFSFIAPFILRVVVGLMLVYVGFRRALSINGRWGKINFAIMAVAGSLITIGLWLQPSSVIALIVSVFWKKFEPNLDIKTIILLVASCLILLLIGPGILAIDLPL